MNRSAAQTTQPATPSLTPTKSILQRTCDCGNHTPASGECEACSAKSQTFERAFLSSARRIVPTVGDIPSMVHSLQGKLTLGQPNDAYEQEADTVADHVAKDISLARSQDPRSDAQSCLTCKRTAGLDPEDDDSKPVGGTPRRSADAISTLAHGGNHRPHVLTPSAHASVVHALRGGHLIAPDVRRTFESSFRHDFSHVRVHTDTTAHEAAGLVGARAFTVGQDIVFGEGQYAPASQPGQWLLAHELTHVVQQSRSGAAPAGSTGPAPIQRDLAVAPPQPGAVAGPLTPDQISEAVRYNQFRFKDPWDIRNVRDVMGIAPVPAVIDEAFVLAVVQWQAEHGLPQDGKVGAETTRTFLRELRGEQQVAKANDLARDNFVTADTIGGPTFNNCGALPRFRWDVSLNTSLRNGFIIQRIDNVWNPQACGAAPLPAIPAPTPRYWESWQVNNLGVVTPSVGALNDRWQRGFPAGSRGNWRMTGTFFTVLTLPAAAGFAPNSVPDAGLLAATVAAPNADALGLVAGQRTIGGTWDCCAPNNTHTPA